MADDLVADWRVQASYRFGPGQQNMLNVRADDFAELGDLLDAIPATIADKLGSAAAALGLTQTVAAGTGAPVQTVSVTGPDTTASAAPGGPPTCAHGPRAYRKAKPDSGKTWEAYFCGAKQGTPGQCDPIFKGAENRNEPYWP